MSARNGGDEIGAVAGRPIPRSTTSITSTGPRCGLPSPREWPPGTLPVVVSEAAVGVNNVSKFRNSSTRDSERDWRRSDRRCRHTDDGGRCGLVRRVSGRPNCVGPDPSPPLDALLRWRRLPAIEWLDMGRETRKNSPLSIEVDTTLRPCFHPTRRATNPAHSVCHRSRSGFSGRPIWPSFSRFHRRIQ